MDKPSLLTELSNRMSRGEITGFVSEPVRKITITLASGKTVVEYHPYKG